MDSDIYSLIQLYMQQYDFINYAMGMRSSKGFHDAIRALAIVKNTFPEVRLNLTGGYSIDRDEELRSLARELGVEQNGSFTPFYEKQRDLFQHIQNSRFALLPCKLDYIPFSIRQAMHYGLPVVCYGTKGTPTLNKEKNCVLIAELDNIEDLAVKMLQLLSDSVLVNTLRDNAMAYSAELDDNKKDTDEIVADLYAVVKHYRFGTPIPKSLLYEA